MKFQRFCRCAALFLLVLLSCAVLSACGKTKETAELGQFRNACENDGLTRSTREAEDPDGDVLEYAAYGHDSENVLVQFYQFRDEDTAREWYQSLCDGAERGPSATVYEMTGSNFLSCTITSDRAYTVITQVEDTIAAATGPLTYKSALDRIMLSIGYLSSNL